MPAQNNVKIQLDSPNEAISLEEEMTLDFTVTNTSEKKVKICRYFTPFEGFAGDYMEITDSDGKKVPYQGVLKKRSKPGKDDYFKLKPGESETVTFVFNKAYPVEDPGAYTVKFKGKEHMNGLPDSEPLEIEVVE